MKKLIPVFAIALVMASCAPKPESLAKKYNDEIHAFLENAINNATSGSAYEMVLPLYQAELLYDSLSNKCFDIFTEEEDIEAFQEIIASPSKDSLYVAQWMRVAEKNHAQLKNLPTNTWMINEDTMSPSSIFKINKAYTEVYPYNYTKVQDLSVPSDKFIPSRFGMNTMLFFDYDADNKRMEIRSTNGKVGHFRKATKNELVMGHFADSFGHEMYVTKNSKIKIEDTKWYIYWQPVSVTQITIDGKDFAQAFKGVSNERNDAIDALISDSGIMAENSEDFIMRRQRSRTIFPTFMLDVPEEEKNIEETETETE